MAKNLVLGEQVFVPASVFDNAADWPSAFVPCQVLDLEDRSVRVEHRDVSKWVATSKCQRTIGLLIFCVGDLETETALLDPLSKSVTQFCRLLAPDDHVRFYKIRSVEEMRAIWAHEHAAYSHVILIGHGSGTALRFATDGWQDAGQLAPVLDIAGVEPKSIINLACQAGKAALGRTFSCMQMCGVYIGAFHSIQGAIASQFVQSFLIHHLLRGETTKIAFRHARNQVAGSTSFRLWRHGVLTTDT